MALKNQKEEYLRIENGSMIVYKNQESRNAFDVNGWERIKVFQVPIQLDVNKPIPTGSTSIKDAILKESYSQVKTWIETSKARYNTWLTTKTEAEPCPISPSMVDLVLNDWVDC